MESGHLLVSSCRGTKRTGSPCNLSLGVFFVFFLVESVIGDVLHHFLSEKIKQKQNPMRLSCLMTVIWISTVSCCSFPISMACCNNLASSTPYQLSWWIWQHNHDDGGGLAGVYTEHSWKVSKGEAGPGKWQEGKGNDSPMTPIRLCLKKQTNKNPPSLVSLRVYLRVVYLCRGSR